MVMQFLLFCTPAYGQPVFGTPTDLNKSTVILGDLLMVDSEMCWNRAKPVGLSLEVFQGNSWRRVGRVTSTRDAGLCASSKYPFTAEVRWEVDRLGASTSEVGVGSLRLRLKVPGSSTRYFRLQVFEDEDTYTRTINLRINDYAGIIACLVQAPDCKADWIGCKFRGKNMYGSVKVVDYGYADFTVKRVSLAPDLRVKLVQYSGYSCGEWKIVDYGFADFTVKIVDYGYADFTIQLVDFAPGR